MPEQVLPITNLHQVGLVADTPPVSLPPNAFTDVRNVRFRDGTVQKMEGSIELFEDLEWTDLQYMVWWANPNLADNRSGYYVVIDRESDGDHIYLVRPADTPVKVDKTPSTPFSSEGTWNHTFFQSGFALIVNNGIDKPHYILDSEGNEETADVPNFAELPGWDSYNTNEVLLDSVFTENSSRVYDLGQTVDLAMVEPVVQLVAVASNGDVTTTDFTAVQPDGTAIDDLSAYTPTELPAFGMRPDIDGNNFTIYTDSSSMTTVLLFGMGLDVNDRVRVNLRSYDIVNVRAGVVRTFGDFLVAGNLTELNDDGDIIRNLAGVVRTSDVAIPGAVPNNWDPFAAGVSTADEFTVADSGVVQDLVELQGALYIYSNTGISVMRRTGNAQVPFSVSPVTNAYGAQTTNAVLEYDGKHIVVGSNDIYLFGGHPGSIQSVSDGRVRRFFFDTLNQPFEQNMFVIRYQPLDEIWICYPTRNSVTGRCDRALVWNYRGNNWTIRDLQGVIFGDVAPIPGGGIPTAEISIDGTRSGDIGELGGVPGTYDFTFESYADDEDFVLFSYDEDSTDGGATLVIPHEDGEISLTAHDILTHESELNFSGTGDDDTHESDIHITEVGGDTTATNNSARTYDNVELSVAAQVPTGDWQGVAGANGNAVGSGANTVDTTTGNITIVSNGNAAYFYPAQADPDNNSQFELPNGTYYWETQVTAVTDRTGTGYAGFGVYSPSSNTYQIVELSYDNATSGGVVRYRSTDTGGYTSVAFSGGDAEAFTVGEVPLSSVFGWTMVKTDDNVSIEIVGVNTSNPGRAGGGTGVGRVPGPIVLTDANDYLPIVSTGLTQSGNGLAPATFAVFTETDDFTGTVPDGATPLGDVVVPATLNGDTDTVTDVSFAPNETLQVTRQGSWTVSGDNYVNQDTFSHSGAETTNNVGGTGLNVSTDGSGSETGRVEPGGLGITAQTPNLINAGSGIAPAWTLGSIGNWGDALDDFITIQDATTGPPSRARGGAIYVEGQSTSVTTGDYIGFDWEPDFTDSTWSYNDSTMVLQLTGVEAGGGTSGQNFTDDNLVIIRSSFSSTSTTPNGGAYAIFCNITDVQVTGDNLAVTFDAEIPLNLAPASASHGAQAILRNSLEFSGTGAPATHDVPTITYDGSGNTVATFTGFTGFDGTITFNRVYQYAPESGHSDTAYGAGSITLSNVSQQQVITLEGGRFGGTITVTNANLHDTVLGVSLNGGTATDLEPGDTLSESGGAWTLTGFTGQEVHQDGDDITLFEFLDGLHDTINNATADTPDGAISPTEVTGGTITVEDFGRITDNDSVILTTTRMSVPPTAAATVTGTGTTRTVTLTGETDTSYRVTVGGNSIDI